MSREEAEEMIMSARLKAGWVTLEEISEDDEPKKAKISLRVMKVKMPKRQLKILHLLRNR